MLTSNFSHDTMPRNNRAVAPQNLGRNKQGISTAQNYIRSALIVQKTVGAFFVQKQPKRRNKMKFKNKNHQALFSSESLKLNRNDNVKMSVLYLLTADVRLWNASKPHIRKGYIDLDNISVKKGNLKSYTLLCVAKDICDGTHYLSIHDLADCELITSKMFGTIITAINIRRYGLNGNKNNNEKENENA